MTLSVKRTNFKKQQKDFFMILDQVIKSTAKELSTEVIIPKEIFLTTKLQFTDITHQSPSVQKLLGKLVDWELIKNRTKFAGDTPLTWGEFIPWYIKVHYNKNLGDLIPGRDGGITFEDIITQLGIQMNNYIPSNYYQYFDLLIRAGVAGVDIKDRSEFGLNEFQRLMDTTYAEQRQTIRNREYNYF